MNSNTGSAHELEAVSHQLIKTEASMAEVSAQAQKNSEAMFIEAARLEVANNTIAHLNEKYEILQTQAERHARELDAVGKKK